MTDTNMAYRSITRRECVEMLCEHNNVLILFHVNPDGDAIGSAFALKTLLEDAGKRAWCVCADEIPERLVFASEGIQDSVLCENIPSDFVPDMIVSVDTASPAQLGNLYDVYKDKISLMIDHHGKGTVYADNYILPEASSCGEVLYGIALDFAEKNSLEALSDKVNYLIYTAISSDTGCFRYNNVEPSTFRIAAELLEKGVPSADVNHKLFGIKTLKQMQVEHAGFERMNLYLGGRIAIITFPYDLKTQYGADNESLETLIDVARCVKGVDICAVIKQMTAENRFRVSMRSSIDFDVSAVCELYGGGGHVRAAGCTLNSDSILAAEMTILSAVETKLAETAEMQT